MAERLTCNHPDVDAPNLVCAQPLPCPYHTAILDVSKPRAVILVGYDLDIKAAKRLIMIGRRIMASEVSGQKQ